MKLEFHKGGGSGNEYRYFRITFDTLTFQITPDGDPPEPADIPDLSHIDLDNISYSAIVDAFEAKGWEKI